MKRYQRGAIITFLSYCGSAFVKLLGADSSHRSSGGWTQVFPPEFGNDDK